MLPRFLVPPGSITDNGFGEALNIADVSDLILITLGIEHVKEQQSLLLGLYGSADGTTWNADPLVEFPQKFYPGVSAVVLDPKAHPSVLFVRAQWKVARWGRGDKTAIFEFYLFAESLAPVAAVTRD